MLIAVVWLSLATGPAFSGSSGQAVAGVPTADAAEFLPPGAPFTRDLAPGEAHILRFELGAGEWLEATVQQQGVDVTVTLLQPDGTPALEIDSREDPMRAERVLWIAGSSGSHALGVRAKPDRPGGRYTVTLVAPRAATPVDTRRAAAWRELERLVRERRDTRALKDRVETQRRAEYALSEFRATNDRHGEAAALEQIADFQSSLNQPASALSYAQAGLALQRVLADRAAEATLLHTIGSAYRAQGDRAQALEHHLSAVRLARETVNPWAEADFLNDIGELHRTTGEAEKAIEWYAGAIARSRASGRRRTEAFSLNNLGIAYKELGDYPRALASYEQAVVLLRALKEGAQEAAGYNNMGNVYKLMGEDTRARDLYLRYLTFARENTPGGEHEARALNNLGSISYRLGAYAEAVDQGRRSLEIRRALNDLPGQALALHNIGQSLHKLGESEEALASLHEALRIRRELQLRYAEADSLLAVAEVERDRGALREALRHAEAAVTLTENLRAAMTSPDLRASFVAAEQDKYGLYIDLLMRRHEQEPGAGHDAAALQSSERARARVLLDTLVEARADIRQGVAATLLDRERALQKQVGEASARLSRLLSRAGSKEDTGQVQRELDARLEDYRQVQSRIRQESPRYAALTQPAPATVEQIRREVLDDDTVLLEFHLGEERSFLWAVSRSALVSQVLPARAEIEGVARKVYALLTERQRTRAPAAVREADEGLQSEMAALGRLLLGGLATRLGTDWKGKRLLVVASGALAYVPFGALPSPVAGARKPLVGDHEVVFAPSASVLGALRQELATRAADGSTVAVIADPVFEAGDPRVQAGTTNATGRSAVPTGLTRAMDSLGRSSFTRLPFSRGEADAIAALVSRPSLLKATDFAASRDLVAAGALGDRRIVHFATHGVLNSEHPDLSGLVLSLVDEKGRPRDGFLRMHEIYNLRLPADLVVLSACQTALGREIRGEGLVGLTRGFMYAGARRVVASLWQVDDESTAELMKRFYRAMLKDGRPPADALRTAQLEMSRSRRWSAPFYWAGFVLQGEWN
jgi:CHAT domain-containing protein/tetratricopeptide (TPR) repeat protein